MKDTIVMSGGDYDRVVQQARADALRDAADVAKSGKKWGDIALAKIQVGELINTPELISDAILALIDQPQEDVCEWVERHKGGRVSIVDTLCGKVESIKPTYKFCPYCSKPIKVKE